MKKQGNLNKNPEIQYVLPFTIPGNIMMFRRNYANLEEEAIG
jgi:hypothetical protein